MGIIETLEQYIHKVYHRNKIPPRVKAKAVLLYHRNMALRKVERFIKALGLRGSREAIRQWYHRLSGLVEYVLKSSQELYVDETKIKGRRRLYYLWLAVDSKGKLCFAYLSRRRAYTTLWRTYLDMVFYFISLLILTCLCNYVLNSALGRNKLC